MEPGTFEAFYASELQHLWALVLVPALFLAHLAAGGFRRAARSGRRDARFVAVYAVVFGVETILDPVATGPVTKALDLGDAAATAVMLLFVLVGDFRVFLLVSGLAKDRRGFVVRAAAWSLVVPFVDLVVFFGVVRLLAPEAPRTILWLVHEVAFLGLALGLRAAWLPRHAAAPPDGHRVFLGRVLLYAALYYGLWATSDVLILAGVDVGWALRAVPNQLYYAFFVPFVFFTFFRRRREPQGS